MSKNIHIFSGSEQYAALLTTFGVIEKGHFEYKKVLEDGRRMRGEYYINFRMLTTPQEQQIIPFYWDALKEFFGIEGKNKANEIIIVGVAMASLTLPKAIQFSGYDSYGIEFAYTEKKDGKLGIWDKQAEKCRGKHVVFIEDVCNNAASLAELTSFMDAHQQELNISRWSVVYGVHRGHAFPDRPVGEVYALCEIFAPSYHPDQIPEHLKRVPLKEYKK